MRICFLSVEIFAWGKYGGFGKATRLIAGELAKRGYDVWAIVPRRADQSEYEELDGIKVLGFSSSKPSQVASLVKQVDADIYHSQEPSMSTYYAQLGMPDRIHVVTLRDTRTLLDWLIELRYPSLSYVQVFSNWLFEDNPFVRRAVRKADSCFVATRSIAEKSKRKYHLPELPQFIPTPVRLPARVEKASRPTVCFLARVDRRKRPEIFLELARDFADVDFLFAGVARDKVYGEKLKKRYEHLPNVKFLGFVDQFSPEGLQSTLGKSWVLVNTAARESLPNSFLEALAHRTALLSSIGTDDLTSRFGYYAKHGDFKVGLSFLLEEERWKVCGEEGFAYVSGDYALDTAIARHIAAYESLLSASSEQRPGAKLLSAQNS